MSTSSRKWREPQVYKTSANILIFFFFFILNMNSVLADRLILPCKVVICGVCKNVEAATRNTIENIELLGSHFQDYKVIIYENNSSDNTPKILSKWSENNSHVLFISENLPKASLPLSRTEKIARARNIVLNEARNCVGFDYLIMADLDFQTPWPIKEILSTIQSRVSWDCVSANGVISNNVYWDYYALRYKKYPFGPELLGDKLYYKLCEERIKLTGSKWVPCYSAFGGLAIYKFQSIIPFFYSGTVTKDLKNFYKIIMQSLSMTHTFVKSYLKILNLNNEGNLSNIPIVFRDNFSSEHDEGFHGITCCEHVPLHASMATHGFRKFYINPQMRMIYPDP